MHVKVLLRLGILKANSNPTSARVAYALDDDERYHLAEHHARGARVANEMPDLVKGDRIGIEALLDSARRACECVLGHQK